MASQHQPNDFDSVADSVSSTPRSVIHDDQTAAAAVQPPARVRFMCSFGGKILPRPHDNQLRYVGGETRIVAVNRHTTFALLQSKLAKITGTAPINIKYQLPNEDLDSLISVTTDEDMENMLEEYDRLVQTYKSATRLRLFLFASDSVSRASSISSLLNGSIKREHWFLDALNGGRGLERGQSEVSSIVSELPDYLFGLDQSDDAPPRDFKVKNKSLLSENNPGSDPTSPAPVASVSSPFCSTSSSLAPPIAPAIPDLPPVKTKPVNPDPLIVEPTKEARIEGVVGDGIGGETMFPQQAGYTSNPMWHYPGPTQPMPVYYVSGPVRPGNVPVQPVPIASPYVQQFSVPPPQGQLPVGFNHPAVSSLGQVYGGGARPITAIDPMSGRIVTDAGNQNMFYGVMGAGMVPGYPGMVVSSTDDIQGTGPGIDGKMGRVSQGY